MINHVILILLVTLCNPDHEPFVARNTILKSETETAFLAYLQCVEQQQSHKIS